MPVVYGDLHIHIGRTHQGKPVKITASPQLNLDNIPAAAKQKGLGLVGLVDAACSGVLRDIQDLAGCGKLKPLAGGGYSWDGVTLFLGHEVELVHTTAAEAHFLAFFPDLARLEEYAKRLSGWVTNPSLSTQRVGRDPNVWLELVRSHGGVALAAHAFTPHKGVYGNCVSKLAEMFIHPEQIQCLELGLSADTAMALQISDTHRYTFVANSDAHSLGSIGREFTAYDLPSVDFAEWENALEDHGRGIVATHGMEPLLGKYYRSYCVNCQTQCTENHPVLSCPKCHKPVVVGVWDRLRAIRDFEDPAPRRPPYRYHVPLIMLPGVGPRTYEELSGKLGTEIDIMYTVSLDALADVAGSNLARQIEAVRSGQVSILPGGGGKYGKVTKVR